MNDVTMQEQMKCRHACFKCHFVRKFLDLKPVGATRTITPKPLLFLAPVSQSQRSEMLSAEF